MKISKEIKVGVVAIFAIAILVWGYNYLKGTNIFLKSKTVYAVYPSVGGLAKSSPVLVNGFQVGIVESIYFHPNQSGDVVAELAITNDEILIPNNSIAKLVNLDFLGSKAIGLVLGDGNKAMESGDTLQTDIAKEVTEQILPMAEKAERLIVSMDSAIVKVDKVLDGLKVVFGEKNQRNVQNILTNFNATILAYKENSANFSATLTSLRPLIKTYKNFGDTLSALQLQQTLNKAQTTFNDISTTLNKLNNGDGTMAQLMNNDSLYNSLDSASKNLDRLMIDLRENPKRYVHFSIFGRKDKKKKN